MDIFNRIRNGWELGRDCFRIILENKRLVIFPVLSMLSLLLVLATFAGGIFGKLGIGLDNLEKMNRAEVYLILFAFYLINYAVIIFFNMSLIHCAMKILNGEEATVKDGIIYSLSRLRLVLSWALLSATVGMLLGIIGGRNNRIRSFIADLLGAAWSIATFFVIPIMAYENLGVFEAVKRSVSLFKNTWGERVGASFSFSLVGLVMYLLICLPLGILIWGTFGFIAGIVFAVSAILIVSCIVVTAETIFTAVAYQYAAGVPVNWFDKTKLTNIFS